MKKGKWLIVVVILVAVIGGLVVSGAISRTKSSDQMAFVNYTELYPTELINSISTKGTVESVTKKNVYSTLAFTIKEVNVEVGDIVTAGQVLCILDPEDLELTIAQQKADLDVSQQSNLNQLQNNQRIYNEASTNLSNSTNGQVLSAESAFKTAEANLENAQKNYNDALKEYQEGTNYGLTTAQSNLLSAELDLDTKKTTFDNNKALYDAGAIAKETYTQSENVYIAAQNKYNDALTGLENARTSQKKALEQSESALKAAQISYDNALAAKDATQVSARQDLEKYHSNVMNSQIAINNDSKVIAIQKLERQLEESIIKAPLSGTITAVYAKEGATGTGLLFVIEDTEHLRIATTISEYDTGDVKSGMSVTIKSDSTGNAVYEGLISKIEPAAIKSANGETALTSNVEYGAQVDILPIKTDLKIGMETKLNVILDKRENAYCVPYDAVTKNSNGENIIFIAIDNGQDKYIVKQFNVITGIKTDFGIEIISDALADGMKVISDTSNIHDGMQINIK